MCVCAWCRYTGGYSASSKYVKRFWEAVESMSNRERASLLRFVTSCERAPPLGFKDLHPQFTIARVSGTIGVLQSS